VESARELPEFRGGEVLVPTGTANEVAFFISSRTKTQVKRPSAGAEGYVLDHYNRAATEAYVAKVGERLLEAFDGAPPYAIFCDSLEVFQSDWTPGFLREFEATAAGDFPLVVNGRAAEIWVDPAEAEVVRIRSPGGRYRTGQRPEAGGKNGGHRYGERPRHRHWQRRKERADRRPRQARQAGSEADRRPVGDVLHQHRGRAISRRSQGPGYRG
jgi:hypothetical protein